MINCLLVDDEPLAMDVIESYLNKVKGFQVVAKCNSPIDAFEILQKQSIDLMFLDIQMPQLSGIELVKTLTNPPKIIFTTAYRDYALEGYELDAVDYLLKPVAFGRFMKAIQKIQRNEALPIPTEEVPLVNETNSLTFIYVKMDKKMIKIYLEDILYIESLKDYVRIITPQQEVITKQKISYLEQKLPEDQFLRIHRSYIIALSKIQAFSTTSIEIEGQEFPIGRSYKELVMKNLDYDERQW